MKNSRILIKDAVDFLGKKVKLNGWVNVRRDHGKLIFIDLRDRSGFVQIVIIPDNEEAYKKAKDIRPEYVVEIEGLVKERPGGAENEKITTGNVEIEVESINVLSEAQTPPFEINEDTKEVGEEIRLKHRYLDLRSERMRRNMRARSKIIQFIRNFYIKKDFLEIETPFLTKGTPEGAREFIVPSRLHKGKFYVLPQSPQQFKQLLMVAGFERYFQIVKCFRDEDQRLDRQPEFTQLDVEMSFTGEEEIQSIWEECLIELVGKYFPEKKITKTPFPKIDYHEAQEKYGTDKPDIREDKDDPNELAFCWVTKFPLFEKDKEGKISSSHHPFTAPLGEDMEMLDKSPLRVRAQAYDIVLNGYEIGGGSIRIHDSELQEKIFEILGLDKETIKKRFGHILKAFKFGVPPHGGIAPGLDRLVMILLNEPNIREVMAFPKTGEAADLMMGAPSELDKEKLREVGIKNIEYTKDI